MILVLLASRKREQTHFTIEYLKMTNQLSILAHRGHSIDRSALLQNVYIPYACT
jgi:hypothetical protein